MGNLTDVQIRTWIRSGKHFEGKSDGGGLTLRFRASDRVPRWLLRYRIGGVARVVGIGTYGTLSLAQARETARELRASVDLGHDVAAEKKERKAAAVAKIEAERNAVTVATLCDEFMAERILGGPRPWKHPEIVRSRIERDIKPAIGNLPLTDVKPADIDALLKAIVKRGAPTMATDVLRWLKRMFDYAIKRGITETNPAAPFDPSDAGGTEKPRDRWLTRDELARLFRAMRDARGWTYQNTLTVRLLLMLAVRKSELIGARIDEFDLDAAEWHLPAERTKTGEALDIPLPTQAVACLRELVRLAGGSAWLLPARKMQTRMIPHIDPNTVNAAIAKSIRPLLPRVPNFTVHDFRRTARTHLAALGVPSHVAERCLNHKLKGVEGIYNRHAYFDERKAALQGWADLLEQLERGGNVVPINKRKSA